MRTRRQWGVGIGTALALLGSGLLLAQTILVTAAVIPLVYLLAGVVSKVPEDVHLHGTRSFDVVGSGPGSTVTVQLTVENAGSELLPDVRIIDGIPEELAVSEGSPRCGQSLSPGERLTLEYTVVLRRGQFEFDEPVVRVRSMAGTDQRTETIPTDGESMLSCANPVSTPPLADVTGGRAGTVPGETGGPGLEFHATRQYHPGDPMNRIDWHHTAKTGEFVTVQYRREHSVRAVVVIDCRQCTRVSFENGQPTGAAMAAYAGERLYQALDSAGVFTTLTAVGLDEELDHLTGADGLPWIHPGAADQRSPSTLFRGLHQISAEAPAGQSSGERTAATDGGTAAWTEKLHSRLPAETQVIICSPLLDEWPVECATSLVGHDRIVVSPDVITGAGLGQRISAIDRRRRLRLLQTDGVRTADWQIDQPIEWALERTFPAMFKDR